jgi:hypothetical protein
MAVEHRVPDWEVELPFRRRRAQARECAPRKKLYRMHRGGIHRIPVCRKSGNMPLPAHLDDFDNSY